MIFTNICNSWSCKAKTLKDRTKRHINHTVFLLRKICRISQTIFCDRHTDCFIKGLIW